jgi:hypothetical protein
VIEQSPIALIHRDGGLLSRVRHGTVREIEEIEIQSFFATPRVSSTFTEIRLDPVVPGIGRQGGMWRRGLESTEGRDGRVASRGHIIDEGLSFCLDVYFVRIGMTVQGRRYEMGRVQMVRVRIERAGGR